MSNSRFFAIKHDADDTFVRMIKHLEEGHNGPWHASFLQGHPEPAEEAMTWHDAESDIRALSAAFPGVRIHLKIEDHEWGRSDPDVNLYFLGGEVVPAFDLAAEPDEAEGLRQIDLAIAHLERAVEARKLNQSIVFDGILLSALRDAKRARQVG